MTKKTILFLSLLASVPLATSLAHAGRFESAKNVKPIKVGKRPALTSHKRTHSTYTYEGKEHVYITTTDASGTIETNQGSRPYKVSTTRPKNGAKYPTWLSREVDVGDGYALHESRQLGKKADSELSNKQLGVSVRFDGERKYVSLKLGSQEVTLREVEGLETRTLLLKKGSIRRLTPSEKETLVEFLTDLVPNTPANETAYEARAVDPSRKLDFLAQREMYALEQARSAASKTSTHELIREFVRNPSEQSQKSLSLLGLRVYEN